MCLGRQGEGLVGGLARWYVVCDRRARGAVVREESGVGDDATGSVESRACGGCCKGKDRCRCECVARNKTRIVRRLHGHGRRQGDLGCAPVMG